MARDLLTRKMLLARAQLFRRVPIRGLSSGIIPGAPKQLADITKLELFEKEDPARIAKIWESHHTDAEGVAGAAVVLQEHDLIVKRAQESPMFVFPVRREGGHFMLLSQYDAKRSMFAMTFLEDYRQNPAMAPPWLSVLIFDDLIQTKQLALMRAEAMEERLRKAEAEHLLMLVRRYYGTDQYDSVWVFNHSERHFNLDKYLAECP